MRRHNTGALVFVATDVVGSTAFKAALGDAAGNVLISDHRRVAHATLGKSEGG